MRRASPFVLLRRFLADAEDDLAVVVCPFVRLRCPEVELGDGEFLLQWKPVDVTWVNSLTSITVGIK